MDLNGYGRCRGMDVVFCPQFLSDPLVDECITTTGGQVVATAFVYIATEEIRCYLLVKTYNRWSYNHLVPHIYNFLSLITGWRWSRISATFPQHEEETYNTKYSESNYKEFHDGLRRKRCLFFYLCILIFLVAKYQHHSNLVYKICYP